ncbi:MAG: 4-hydroxybutyryl-CoA dehydratase / vinylacetyl-CoA-Delta-isomerase [Acidimicrobiaceae bacterium]|jgi:4-hydroxybutyryl-CoA dehydratase/vinylacetyl-CoA-Delta-isomerase|nr:4-hydroxybutyryl-CoA dehydratase / vinylacetyl-CoA-Delta-isomerase [Acidimicrobiaceae bacterium]
MLTGEQYLSSLDDDRVTYYEGHQVKDLLSEPAFAVPARSVAAGYDRCYSSEPGATNPLVVAPRSPEELRERAGIISEMDLALNVTYQSLMTLLTAAPRMHGVDPVYVNRLQAYVDDSIRDDIRIAECITDAKGNRSLAPAKQDDPDSYVHVVDRRSDGVVIRGAKLHISAASLCHDLLVMPTKSMKVGEEGYAVTCAVPVSSPGVSVINTTYHPKGDDVRHFPVSSRASIPDGFVVFDDVFVPDERIFLDGETSNAAIFAHSLGLWERLGGITAMVRQADELVGLAQLIAEANGLAGVSHIREKIDEMAIHATLLRAGMEAALSHAKATPEGFYYPDELFTNAAKYQGAAEFGRMVRHLHDIAGGSVLTSPSLADLDNPATHGYVEKYMRGNAEISAEERLRLFHAIRDLTADAYGGWHLVTNLQSGGGLFAQRIVTRRHYDMARAKAIARHSAGLDAD